MGNYCADRNCPAGNTVKRSRARKRKIRFFLHDETDWRCLRLHRDRGFKFRSPRPKLVGMVLLSSGFFQVIGIVGSPSCIKPWRRIEEGRCNLELSEIKPTVALNRRLLQLSRQEIQTTKGLYSVEVRPAISACSGEGFVASIPTTVHSITEERRLDASASS